MKITVLSPHRDDAAFSLGLAIDAWITQGHRVTVVNCFTRSAYAPFGEAEFVHENDLRSYVTALRLREDLRWSRMYRRPPLLDDLNLRDAPLRLRCRVDAVCSEPVLANDGAIRRIRSWAQSSPADVLALPLALGGHVDHRTARQAAEAGWPEARPLAYYEDLPYAARAAGNDSAFDEIRQRGFEPCFAAEPGDVAAAIERKRRLALCYDSQIDNATTMQIAEFCIRYEGRERLWANRAWREALPGGGS